MNKSKYSLIREVAAFLCLCVVLMLVFADPARSACEPDPAPQPDPTDQMAQLLSTLPAGEWLTIPNTKLDTVKPIGNYGYHPNVVNAWNSAAWSTAHLGLYIAAMGGHADYYGDEAYKFDTYALEWQRVAEPLGVAGSRHTYDSLEIIGDYLYISGSCQGASCDDANEVRFNLVTNQYEDIPENPYPGSQQSGTVANGKYYTGGAYDIVEYDPATDTWSEYVDLLWNAWQISYQTSSEYAPNKDYIVYLGGGRAHVVNRASPSLVAITINGCNAHTANAPGLAYANGKLYAFDGNIHEIDLDTFNCTTLTNSSAPLSMNGVYGRFRYMDIYNAFIYVEKTTEDVRVFKVQ